MWTNGFAQRPLEGGEHPALRGQLLAHGHRLGPAPARHHLHGHDADAGVVERLHERVVAVAHREVVGHEDDVHLLLDGGGDDLGVPGVQAHAGEADLALLLRDALRVEELVGDARPPPSCRGGTRCPRGRCRAGVRLSSRWARASAFVPAARLRRDVDLVAPALEGRADEALVVAALVAARGVEEVHAEVGGALDDALVRGDHAAEGHLGDLEAGLAELALADDGRARRAGAGAIAGGAGFGVSIDAWAAAGRARPVRADAVRNSRRERGLDMADSSDLVESDEV